MSDLASALSGDAPKVNKTIRSIPCAERSSEEIVFNTESSYRPMPVRYSSCSGRISMPIRIGRHNTLNVGVQGLLKYVFVELHRVLPNSSRVEITLTGGENRIGESFPGLLFEKDYGDIRHDRFQYSA